MDITNFIISGRDKALLYGDYATYRTQLSRRLLVCRKKLGIVTRKRAKYKQKEPVTAQNIQNNHGHLHLLLLTSERAWAHAMAMKASHATNIKGITGRTRSHIVSRLTKATRTAEHLAHALAQSSESGAAPVDILEARAYAAMLEGAAQFEKQSWKPCLGSYAIARVIYSALLTALKSDMFKDLLAETVDPSIRYASYQLKTPRTVPIPTIARESFPLSDRFLVDEVDKLDQTILSPDKAPAADSMAVENVPQTLTWRSREVPIEDAAIAQSWGSVLAAKSRLQGGSGGSEGSEGSATTSLAAGGGEDDPKKLAANYDGVLMASQEAADATKRAIDELKEEGVPQSDPRMQSLQVTRTAVNYEMISWRIGRNRVLTGPHDGALEDSNARRPRKPRRTSKVDTPARRKEEKLGRRIIRLKEKIALYDGTLQNLEAVKDLPGIAADGELTEGLTAITDYFLGLKCLSVARSHSLVGNLTNALALINHAYNLSERASPILSKGSAAEPSNDSALNIDVAPDAAKFVQDMLNGELQRHRALVHIQNLRAAEAAKTASQAASPDPLINRLNDCAIGEVDLRHIVQLPPELTPIPAKPIFLDIAWNYIDYPGQDPKATTTATSVDVARTSETASEQVKQKRGWFNFGR